MIMMMMIITLMESTLGTVQCIIINAIASFCKGNLTLCFNIDCLTLNQGSFWIRWCMMYLFMGQQKVAFIKQVFRVFRFDEPVARQNVRSIS